MPHGGKADDVTAWGYANGYRTVEVIVSSTGNYYCTSLVGSWQPWVNCT